MERTLLGIDDWELVADEELKLPVGEVVGVVKMVELVLDVTNVVLVEEFTTELVELKAKVVCWM